MGKHPRDAAGVAVIDAAGLPIRTPDQRLRVFVSSTLKELAPERRAARAAIERLRLAPVMFELGARPHPPRQLYRAYLEQSDVFVGIYWQQYGWTAPGEDISGLEDEYRLAPRDMPKLIYVKQPAEREERLGELMRRVRDDDSASYQTFSSVDELAELIEGDLATLLAERFDASRMTLAVRLRNDDGIAFALEGLGAAAAVTGDVGRGGMLLGAADALRARTGLADQRSYVTYQPFVDAVLASEGAAAFEEARATGRRMPRRAVLEAALGPELAAAATTTT